MNRGAATIFRRGVSIAESKPVPDQVSASQIRKSFLDFFCEGNDHFHVPSSPVLSLLDPTLTFVNAGMNQFKNVFLGLVHPAASRVANSQKCIRIGGKHNDLSQVGHDGTHHSFFEMLGNWSFGDYFKKEACHMSWDLLVKVYNLPPERLYVTYFKGDETLGLDPDFNVREIWRELGVKESHILPFGMKENFWEMGPAGPCGVCTEIHYDHVPGRKDAGHLVNCDGKGVSELWNLVFMQYNRKEDGTLQPLKKHFVDTGMGYERLVAILQGKSSNYDTDLFLPLFGAISRYSGHSGYTGTYAEGTIDSDYRILADHGRMIAVALSDGVIPNHHNKVRMIIRRALAVCENAFKCDYKLLTAVADHVAESLADAYPEIERNLPKVRYLIEEEDENLKIVQKSAMNSWKELTKEHPNPKGLEVSDVIKAPNLLEGLRFVKKSMKEQEKGDEYLSPQNAWIMFDTLGISPEISAKIASSLGLKMDLNAYNDYEKQFKKAIKQTSYAKLQNQVQVLIQPEVIDELGLEPTKDYFKQDHWLDPGGKYVFPEQSATIQAIFCDSQILQTISFSSLQECKNSKFGLVLDRTQFYSSEHNRKSDRGIFLMKGGVVFSVENAVKLKDSVIHYGTFTSFPSDAEVSVRDEGVLRVDGETRLQMMRNHTALNLLKAGIRAKTKVTGEKQSLVRPDGFRLEIMTYKDKLELDTVVELERFVNTIIRHDVSVRMRCLSHCQVQELGDVVFFPGVSLLKSEIDVFEVNSGYTVIREHCTGAHVLRTSHIEDFVITKLQKVGYCLYGIEGVTGPSTGPIRKADDGIQREWTALKEYLSSSKLNDGEKQEKLKELRKSVASSSGLSHIVGNEIVKEAEKMWKKLKKKGSERPR